MTKNSRNPSPFQVRPADRKPLGDVNKLSTVPHQNNSSGQAGSSAPSLPKSTSEEDTQKKEELPSQNKDGGRHHVLERKDQLKSSSDARSDKRTQQDVVSQKSEKDARQESSLGKAVSMPDAAHIPRRSSESDKHSLKKDRADSEMSSSDKQIKRVDGQGSTGASETSKTIGSRSLSEGDAPEQISCKTIYMSASQNTTQKSSKSSAGSHDATSVNKVNMDGKPSSQATATDTWTTNWKSNNSESR